MSIVNKFAHNSALLGAQRGRDLVAHAGVQRGAYHVRSSATATEFKELKLTGIPKLTVEKDLRSDLAQKLSSRLQGIRWDEEPDRFDDTAFACLQEAFHGGNTILTELKDMLDDPNSPCALHITGLPVEEKLPATPSEPPVQKEGQISEALLMGFSRVWGRATGFPGAGPQGICRDLIAVESNMHSSSSELTMHRDFGIAPEHVVPDFRLIYCIRPDKKRQVKTLVADNRDVLRAMDPQDVNLLRTVPVKLSGPNLGVPKLMVQGNDDFPALSLFDMAVFNGEGSITSEDPAAVDAYHRAADVAMDVSSGVCLQEGELLIINNNRATHARTRSPHEQDGMGRWMKVTFCKAGAGPGHERYLEM